MLTTQRGYPDPEAADTLLSWAEEQNKGPWAHHCRVAARAAKMIAACSGMDDEKAYALGLLHDIGRYEGVRDLHHVYAGHELMTRKGYVDCAKICMTHSFPVPDIRAYGGGSMDCDEQEIEFIKTCLTSYTYDDYDLLIQLCDSLALPEGICLLEVRLVDVVRRYGFNTFTKTRWDAFFAIKRHFDELCGMNIYNLFYDEIRKISFR